MDLLHNEVRRASELAGRGGRHDGVVGDRLVFVTVGNATQGFRRLLDAIDRLAGDGFFNGEVVLVQAGNNPDFRSSHCKQESFLPAERFIDMICKADLVIAHAGAGTLLQVLQAGKIPIVMPRQRKYGEHIDDHQVDLVKALAADGRVIAAYEPGDLPGAIAEARRRAGSPIPPPPTRMIALIAAAIEELMG